MPSDESKGSQLDAIGSLAQRQLDNTVAQILSREAPSGVIAGPRTTIVSASSFAVSTANVGRDVGSR